MLAATPSAGHSSDNEKNTTRHLSLHDVRQTVLSIIDNHLDLTALVSEQQAAHQDVGTLSKALRHDAWFSKSCEHATERHVRIGSRTVYPTIGPIAYFAKNTLEKLCA
jgi:hypothetical protein